MPLGAWVSSAVFDLGTGNQDAARKLVAIGLVSTRPAVVLGLADFSELEQRQRRVGILHAVVNTAAALIFAASYRARRRDEHRKGALLGMVGLSVVSAGGTLGGHLSYAQGAGVHRWQDFADRT